MMTVRENGRGAWGPAAPVHFDSAWPWWVKAGAVAVLLVGAFWVDQPVAAWAMAGERLPGKGDVWRELMWLEQNGQWTCSVVVIAAVALLDKEGRRKALAIALGCLLTAAACYVLKGVAGRTRPGVMVEGLSWFLGPEYGFTRHYSPAFPSAHTTGAFALAAGLAWFYPRGRGLFYGLACVTAGQRVLHHAHYVSDVVAGAVLAVGVMRGSLRWKLAGRVMGGK